MSASIVALLAIVGLLWFDVLVAIISELWDYATEVFAARRM